jgi:GNAT superfamily N-acetyltransferase
VAEVTIRQATQGDLQTLRVLLTALHEEPPWGEHETQAAHATLALISADSKRALLLGFVGDEPAGTIDVIVSPNLTRHVRPFALVENVVVLPRFRRTGVGRQLMGAAVAFARAQDCYKVQLVSANRRDAAHHLYRALGFDADVSGYRRYLTP